MGWKKIGMREGARSLPWVTIRRPFTQANDDNEWGHVGIHWVTVSVFQTESVGVI